MGSPRLSRRDSTKERCLQELSSPWGPTAQHISCLSPLGWKPLKADLKCAYILGCKEYEEKGEGEKGREMNRG